MPEVISYKLLACYPDDRSCMRTEYHIPIMTEAPTAPNATYMIVSSGLTFDKLGIFGKLALF